MQLKQDFLNYANSIKSFCPYLSSSMEKDLLEVISINLYSESDEKLEEELFYQVLFNTEIFRLRRKNLRDNDIEFYASNIVFDHKDSVDVDWEKIISWPHYMLKKIYSGDRIMFGKFWKGEETISRKGIPIPIPKINFISIRTAIRDKDPIFLSGMKDELDNTIANSSIHYDNYEPPFINYNEVDVFNISDMQNKNLFTTLKEKIYREDVKKGIVD